MESEFVDFHCHLDLFKDFELLIKQTEEAKIHTLTVTTTPRAWPKNRDLTKNLKYVKAALGLHPQIISERSQEIEIWNEFQKETRFIGEIGLDRGPMHLYSIELQKVVFKKILTTCAKSGDKILSLHSLQASQLLLEMLEEYFPYRKGKTILHWFTGNKNQVEKAVRLNCFFSINRQMLNTKSGTSLARIVPSDRILTETDGPFIYRGNTPYRPWEVEDAVKKLSQLRDIEFSDLKMTIRRNLDTLLR
ncbi:Qat anti-phage system TatD family nuclease QatD [Leptospira wolffii]|uniref:Qat anti-phage system TatD family nuclease QatD n=1 Tax=Leptospira wolffii TaxID=409998 RepID=UPI000302828C|nr:Qat anti-phage system TatD family nuclease QatD [Leptospira wolffii]EPG64637.1 hydrolase, TatD family [Leptospira wolffii serovar Khorat str. Khorat-H2]